MSLSQCSVRTVKAQKSSKRVSKLTAPNAIGVKTSNACGGSFSSSIRIGAGCLRSAARSLLWSSMAAGFAIPPACCGSVPRP